MSQQLLPFRRTICQLVLDFSEIKAGLRARFLLLGDLFVSNVFGYRLFCFLYLLPYVGGVDISNRMGPVLVEMLRDVFASPTFVMAALGVLLAHLLALWLCWPVYRAVEAQLRLRLTTRPWMSVMAASVLLWVALYGLNQVIFHETRHQVIDPVVVMPLSFAASAIVLALVLIHLWRFRFRWISPHVRHKPVMAVTGVAAVVVFVGLGYNESVEARMGQAQSSRNIIIIGIDSLSQRVLEAHPEAMPKFMGLYRQSVAYTNAWSPTGRTCPTWLSILSGQTPAQHGGVFNLRQSDQVDRAQMLPVALREQGYDTVFGLDERRFCGIDESFGFDVVVGPDHGAMDFLVQKFNDAPLVNVFLQSKWSSWLLPHSRLNVAAHATYPALDFVDAVNEAVVARDQRLFMAVHLESGHYPYVARDARQVLAAENRFLSAHVNALTVVDDQISVLMSKLRDSGRLNDALVVFLSDHGESFGDPRLVHQDGQPPLEARVYGHGTSVLMAEQNHVVLAYLQYRQGEVVNAPESRAQMVSLLDVRAMLESFAQGGSPDQISARECVVLETGIRMKALADYTKMDETQAAALGAAFYAVDKKGRMHLREGRMAELIRLKDIGARCGDTVTKFDAEDQSYVSYLDSEKGLTQVALHEEGLRLVKSYQAELEMAARSAERLSAGR